MTATTTTEQVQSQSLPAHSHTRFIRQLDFVPTEAIEGKKVTVIGCGAIGRQVAIQLAAIGVQSIQLIDFDTVTLTNVTTQGFRHGDIYVEKVTAVGKAIKEIDPGIEVIEVCDRFRNRTKTAEVVFVCVDSIEVRQLIWDVLKDKDKLIIDGRMNGEVWRVICSGDEESRKHYPTTLFPPEKAVQGRCTAHATIYSASMPASWMVNQFTKHLRGLSIDQDMCCNMLAGELFPVKA